jgi:phosphoenolpyruvate carboxylase
LVNDEALALDVKINGLSVIAAVPIEGIGSFSFRGHLSMNSPL